MISRFVIQKHFSGSRNFVRQPRRMALLLLVRGGVILTGSEARIWKKGTVHCIQLSSGWSGGESLTCAPRYRVIKVNELALTALRLAASRKESTVGESILLDATTEALL